ncbi:YozE family protein [Roseateles sp. MS654]|uniref:YozE family protein n=1 Tax=Roseateles sp. MS654 TaxID=3412685 RepID=UPI003C3084FA
MATPLTPARIEQLKRAAKRMVREQSIPLHEAQQQLAEANGFKNWSLLQKHALLGAATKPLVTPPPPARVLGSKDRYYLHGDQHAEHPTKFFCRSCDEFVEAEHFFAKHDQRETLQRALNAINRWATRDPAQQALRPLGAPNLLEAPARAQAAAHEASRSSFHRWLERQKGRNSPTGDIARDILGDEGFPVTANTYEAAEAYLHSQFASSAAVKALKGAWLSFQTAQKRTKAPTAGGVAEG